MDKSLEVGEDEWREKERKNTKFYASNEVWTLKCNFSNDQSWKKYTHKAFIYSLSVTQNWREIWISIQIPLEFEIEVVESNFGAKISLIMISEF